MEVEAQEGQKAKLPLVVVSGEGPGRNWLEQLKLDWQSIHQCRVLNQEEELTKLLALNGEVYKDELGELKTTTVQMHINHAATPKFCKPRSVPYAVRQKVEELFRLQKAKIIEPVQYSDWSAPIVPVIKGDGSVRICVEYKMTVIKVAKLDTYPFPKINDIYSQLVGDKISPLLIRAELISNLMLDKNFLQYVTISTHKGLFRYNRLPFGVASALEIFRRTMESLLQGIPGTVVYLDNIFWSPEKTQEYLHNLTLVLQKLQDAGLWLSRVLV